MPQQAITNALIERGVMVVPEERLSALEKVIVEQKQRIDDLILRLAVKDEREKQIYMSLEAIRADVNKLNGLLQKAGYFVIAAIVLAALKFIVDGGLVNVAT